MMYAKALFISTSIRCLMKFITFWWVFRARKPIQAVCPFFLYGFEISPFIWRKEIPKILIPFLIKALAEVNVLCDI